MANILTVADYKAAVRNRLDDASYDDAKLLQFINSANKEVCNTRRWRFMEQLFVGTIAAGFTSYDLPATFQAAINFTVQDPDANAIFLNYVPYEQFDKQYPDPTALTATVPSIWTFFSNSLIIGPAKPDKIYTMQLRYIKSPTVVTLNADILDVPDDFSEVVELMVYKRCLQTNDNYGQANVIAGEIVGQLDAMSERLQSRQYGESLVMQTGRFPTQAS